MACVLLRSRVLPHALLLRTLTDAFREGDMTADEALQLAADEGLELIASYKGNSEYKGVTYQKRKANNPHPWNAQVWDYETGKVIRLGQFACAEAAALVYARHVAKHPPTRSGYKTPTRRER